MKKKVLSLLLAVVLIFSSTPVFAGTTASEMQNTLKNTISDINMSPSDQVDLTLYPDFKTAYDQAVSLLESDTAKDSDYEQALGNLRQAYDARSVKAHTVTPKFQDMLLSNTAADMLVGERFQFAVYDVPRASDNDNNFCRRDLEFTFLKGSDVIAIEKEEYLHMEKEAAYYFIKGLKPGIAVFTVNYPGYKGDIPKVIINVVESKDRALKVDIALNKYDTVYFYGNDKDYSFNVSTGSKKTPVSVKVNNKVYNAQKHSKENGENLMHFDVKLKHGYNTIEIEDALGNAKVANIRALKIKTQLMNLSRPHAQSIKPNERAAVIVEGLVHPMPKLSRIYNYNYIPTWQTSTPREKSVPNPETGEIMDSEKKLVPAGAIATVIPTYKEGKNVLTNGKIHMEGFGSPMWSECKKFWWGDDLIEGTDNPEDSSISQNAPQTRYDVGILPDIMYTVEDEPEYEFLPAEPMNYRITNDKGEETVSFRAGEKVTITFDGKNYPWEKLRDDYQGDMGILKAYTSFKTDIKNLSEVKGDFVRTKEIPIEEQNLSTYEKILTLSFTIPEDTENGTYRLYDGCTQVEYGIEWWMHWAERFYDFYPMDISIQVKAKPTVLPPENVDGARLTALKTFCDKELNGATRIYTEEELKKSTYEFELDPSKLVQRNFQVSLSNISASEESTIYASYYNPNKKVRVREEINPSFTSLSLQANRTIGEFEDVKVEVVPKDDAHKTGVYLFRYVVKKKSSGADSSGYYFEGRGKNYKESEDDTFYIAPGTSASAVLYYEDVKTGEFVMNYDIPLDAEEVNYYVSNKMEEVVVQNYNLSDYGTVAVYVNGRRMYSDEEIAIPFGDRNKLDITVEKKDIEKGTTLASVLMHVIHRKTDEKHPAAAEGVEDPYSYRPTYDDLFESVTIKAEDGTVLYDNETIKNIVDKEGGFNVFEISALTPNEYVFTLKLKKGVVIGDSSAHRISTNMTAEQIKEKAFIATTKDSEEITINAPLSGNPMFGQRSQIIAYKTMPAGCVYQSSMYLTVNYKFSLEGIELTPKDADLTMTEGFDFPTQQYAFWYHHMPTENFEEESFTLTMPEGYVATKNSINANQNTVEALKEQIYSNPADITIQKGESRKVISYYKQNEDGTLDLTKTGNFRIEEKRIPYNNEENAIDIKKIDGRFYISGQPSSALFGSYAVYELSSPIKNDSSNPYGVDFTITGSYQEEYKNGILEVMVSKDGKTFYTLAGSGYFTDKTKKDTRVTYHNGVNVMYEKEDGQTGFLAKERFSNDIKENSVTVTANEIDLLAGDTVYGYANKFNCKSVSPRPGMTTIIPIHDELANPYAVKEYNTNPMDISWAVDRDGNTVNLDEINYVRINYNYPIEKFNMQGQYKMPQEISAITKVDTSNTKATGKTEMSGILVNGEPLELSKNKYEYRIIDENDSVNIAAVASAENIIINNKRVNTLEDVAIDNTKGIQKVRIVAQDGTDAPSIYTLTISKSIPIEDIEIETSEVHMDINGTYKINARVLPQNTTEDIVFTYTSLKPGVATVGKDGTITAQAPGEAVILVKCGQINKQIVVTVNSILTDINEDGRVNAEDLLLILTAYGQTKPQNVRCDINKDEIVNAADLLMLLTDYGKSI